MATSEDPSYIRLHITPLNPPLLTTILPPSILPSARNISYHNIQTFPERAYGYVDLPTMDAERIKKKLNGSILKGTKVRIETARSQKEIVAEEPEAPKVKKEKSKKRKRDEITAVDIGKRHVKRGWTVSDAKAGKDKVVVKSKYTTKPECLFKTVLPLNVASAKDAKPEKRKHKKGKEAVVHEFSKTTKYATFLRSSSAAGNKKGVAEFVEWKGWVDEDGNVVEVVKEPTSKGKKVEIKPKEVLADSMHISEESSSDESSEEEDEVPAKTHHNVEATTKNIELSVDLKDETRGASQEDSSEASSLEDDSDLESTGVIGTAEAIDEDSTTSDSDSSSAEDDTEAEKETSVTTTNKTASGASSASSSSNSSTNSSESESGSNSKPSPPTPPTKTSRPQSASGPPPGLSIKIPSTTPSTLQNHVHPLESLYKRSNTTQQPAASKFSFFGADNEDDEEAEDIQPQVPLTPFTQRDFEYRGLRSAAPTPDTAHANKRFVWPVDEDEGELGGSSPIRDGKGELGKEGGGKVEGEAESEFQKWFYEHRGEANRAWKKRRKVVGKEKRQRENRKRQERI